MNGEALKGHLDFLLLAIVREGPAHGYAIIEALRQRSDRVFDLPEGTIYPALHRLEADHLLSSRWSETTGRRRRIYQITTAGEQTLAYREKEWRRFVQAVNATVRAN